MPDELRYDPVTNPGGARCTVQDSAVNLLGSRPGHRLRPPPGRQHRVQYGLRALQAGLITVADFLDVNRQVGGFDIDAQPASRSACGWTRTWRRSSTGTAA